MDAPRGFLKTLNMFGRGSGGSAAAGSAEIKNRKARRHDVTGAKVNLLVEANLYVLHLKDLSSLGLCGLTDAPLAPEQNVVVFLAEHQPVPLQIRWIRRTLVGARFFERLPDETMQRLLRLHGREHRQG